MSKYVVIKFFTDLQDNRHAYNVGDEFPREGIQVSNKRLAELAGPDNRQRVPLIKEVAESVEEEPEEEFEPEESEEPEKLEEPKVKNSRKRRSKDDNN